jgi:hypothetical protein
LKKDVPPPQIPAHGVNTHSDMRKMQSGPKFESQVVQQGATFGVELASGFYGPPLKVGVKFPIHAV